MGGSQVFSVMDTMWRRHAAEGRGFRARGDSEEQLLSFVFDGHLYALSRQYAKYGGKLSTRLQVMMSW